MKLLILDEEPHRPPLRRLLNLYRGIDVVASKLDGFDSRRRSLRSRLGLEVESRPVDLGRLGDVLRGASADLVLLVPSWRHAAERFRDVLAGVEDRRPPLAIFDTFDQTSSPFFGSIRHVDLYLKSQVLRDTAAYRRPYAGGFVVADWVHRDLGFDLGGWHFGSPLAEGDEAKLARGWNMGISRLFLHLARLMRLVARPWGSRPVEVNRRFGTPDPSRVPKWEWYQEYRRFCGFRVGEMEGDFRMTGNTPLPRGAYLREMARSRVAFSPFGWGEVCFRDFEAVACGAVLVKPDMSHLSTEPDIYENDVTYKAVRWDLADLPEVCRWVLDHPREAREMTSAARRRLLGYLGGGGFDRDASRLAGLVPDARESMGVA
jgi:Glycosyl transferases group 1